MTMRTKTEAKLGVLVGLAFCGIVAARAQEPPRHLTCEQAAERVLQGTQGKPYTTVAAALIQNLSPAAVAECGTEYLKAAGGSMPAGVAALVPDARASLKNVAMPLPEPLSLAKQLSQNSAELAGEMKKECPAFLNELHGEASEMAEERGNLARALQSLHNHYAPAGKALQKCMEMDKKLGPELESMMAARKASAVLLPGYQPAREINYEVPTTGASDPDLQGQGSGPACRATFGWVVATPASATPLPCSLDRPPAGLQIAAVTSRNDTTGTSTPIQPASGGAGFQLPVGTKGTFVVNVTLNQVAKELTNLVEVCGGNTQILAIADQGANFDLQVQ